VPPGRIGDEVAFETKVAMAKAMVRRAITDNLPVGNRGCRPRFQQGLAELERADVFPAMATTRHDTVVTRWAMDHPGMYKLLTRRSATACP
jgi:hypothetical protein